MREASRKQHDTTGCYTPLLRQALRKIDSQKTVACPSSFAFSTILYWFSLKTRHICIILDDELLTTILTAFNVLFPAIQAFFLSQNGKPRHKKEPRNEKIPTMTLGPQDRRLEHQRRGERRRKHQILA